ncbi:MAG: VOC family protein [Candidatus Woesearchaeota archaeon]|nr:VOC family protein [Candidatus Woesearchaeota archaeon]
MNERNLVGWFEIYVNDIERAKSFYESVFERTLEALSMDGMEMWMFPGDPNNAGCAGALVKMDGMEPGGTSTIVYFTSEDCAVEAKRVLEHGGKIHAPKMSIGEHGFITLAIDTEGNMIGIHSMK